ERNNSSAGLSSAAGRRVRMGGNCKKPAFSVANTGSSGTPEKTSRPCGRWGFSGATNALDRVFARLHPGVGMAILERRAPITVDRSSVAMAIGA
ncbi:hypothetical protein, partial [Xanthomonas fragariae]|uniref:hypothetical protein n=1 Tax=Xanthomonas fragariae TaxID=48664 RepID=UPI001F2C5734